MMLSLAPRRLVVIALAWVGVVPLGVATAQEKPGSKPAAKSAEGEIQRVEGVIIQAKPFAIRATEGSKIQEAADENRPLPRRYRLTINTAIPWNDYVRDEAVDPEKAEKGKDPAPRTKESVATEGQPAAKPNEQVVDITPDTKIELRYRSSTDESDDGAATVEGAEDAQSDPASKTKPDEKGKSAKPAKLEADGLRVGQYVIVEYRKSVAQIPATKIIVLKPVGGAETSAKDAEEEKPATKKTP